MKTEKKNKKRNQEKEKGCSMCVGEKKERKQRKRVRGKKESSDARRYQTQAQPRMTRTEDPSGDANEMLRQWAIYRNRAAAAERWVCEEEPWSARACESTGPGMMAWANSSEGVSSKIKVLVV